MCQAVSLDRQLAAITFVPWQPSRPWGITAFRPIPNYTACSWLLCCSAWPGVEPSLPWSQIRRRTNCDTSSP